MDLEALNKHPLIVRRKRKRRIGRGEASGWGKTAGRGHKGAHARSGWKNRYSYEGGQMPLTRRIPKRGFTNALFKREYEVINVSRLNVFDDGTEVDAALLRERGLIKNGKLPLKVLGDGELTTKLVLRVDRCTTGAREKVEALGGEVVELAPPKRKRRRKAKGKKKKK